MSSGVIKSATVLLVGAALLYVVSLQTGGDTGLQHAIGVSSGSQPRQAPRLPSVSRLSQQQKTAYSEEQYEALQTFLQRPRRNNIKPVLAFTLLSPEVLQRLGRVFWSTWMRDMQIFCDIVVYTTDCSIISTLDPPLDKGMEKRLRCLGTAEDETVLTEFSMWLDMHSTYLEEYSWFLRVDQWSYPNAEALALALADMSPSNSIYLGKPVMGRPEDQEMLQLQGRPYCQGLAYLWSKALLSRIGPDIENCRDNPVTQYADVEV